MNLKYVMIAMAATVTLHAGVTDLTFEGLQNQEEVLNYYNGGSGSLGSGPGPNYGITFGSDSLAIIQSNVQGGTGNFGGEPSADTALFFLSGAGDIMDVAAGFTTGFSFYYSAINEGGSVTVYDGLDGTGNLLATLTLPTTPNTDAGGSGSGNCSEYGSASNPGANFCPFVEFGVTFDGTAESVNFSGTANQIAFDNITLGSATAVGGVPEPSTWMMMGLGLAGIAIFGKFRTAPEKNR